MTDKTQPTDPIVTARRREIATEHVVFKLLQHVESAHPGLLDSIEASLDHLGDNAHDDTKDDAAVRQIAQRMIDSARSS
ncbi:hypothetical protein ACFSGX_14850 [Sphingomonas arantia]|uniref:Uncharacterized protein n=1 Tax=Sphingomonas arantia TaxID=1460676 RepID=A0ABW4TZ87_9SPHN